MCNTLFKLRITKLLSLLLVAAAVGIGIGSTGCTRKVDTSKDFAMALNGRPYEVALGNPIARMHEIESGFNESFGFKILFPTQRFNRPGLETNGFELTFDPQTVAVGEVIESSAGDQNYSLALSYYPLVGHRMNQGMLLQYSSKRNTGSLKVQFDILEPEIGGRVKGKILNATLFGFYQREGGGSDITEPPSPLKLEIYNFVFDTTFERSMF